MPSVLQLNYWFNQFYILFTKSLANCFSFKDYLLNIGKVQWDFIYSKMISNKERNTISYFEIMLMDIHLLEFKIKNKIKKTIIILLNLL